MFLDSGPTAWAHACVGEPSCTAGGTGWGSIEGIAVRVFLLPSPDHTTEARGISRALAVEHAPMLFEERGLLSALFATRAAAEHHPHLVHALGVSGPARAAPAIAAGLRVPLVLSLTTPDLEGSTRGRAVSRAKSADLLLVDEGRTAERLRELGVDRELYVLAPPPGPALDAAFARAIEIVYGRLLGAHSELLEHPAGHGEPGREAAAGRPATPPAARGDPPVPGGAASSGPDQLVQLGRRPEGKV